MFTFAAHRVMETENALNIMTTDDYRSRVETTETVRKRINGVMSNIDELSETTKRHNITLVSPRCSVTGSRTAVAPHRMLCLKRKCTEITRFRFT